MFIPPNRLKDNFESDLNIGSEVRLKSSHIHIDKEIAAEVFGKDLNVFVVYYPEKKSLMVSPVSNVFFKKLHKASQHMLKDRNLKGDKTIALHEIIIDNQIDETDRDLEYELQPGLGILNIKL
ncbi:MAG TPA: hypothetical protein ENJ95_24415 [Bacteroidetes bacterium]|nr:hypothetical protein [Bacteroidota bacterium]